MTSAKVEQFKAVLMQRYAIHSVEFSVGGVGNGGAGGGGWRSRSLSTCPGSRPPVAPTIHQPTNNRPSWHGRVSSRP